MPLHFPAATSGYLIIITGELELLSVGSEVQILLWTGFKAFEMLAGLADNERFCYFF